MKEQILALTTLISTAILPASNALHSNAGWPISGAEATHGMSKGLLNPRQDFFVVVNVA